METVLDKLSDNVVFVFKKLNIGLPPTKPQIKDLSPPSLSTKPHYSFGKSTAYHCKIAPNDTFNCIFTPPTIPWTVGLPPNYTLNCRFTPQLYLELQVYPQLLAFPSTSADQYHKVQAMPGLGLQSWHLYKVSEQNKFVQISVLRLYSFGSFRFTI